MKNITTRVKTSILVLFSLLLISCDDFLTTVPESDYSVEGFYQTESDFKYAIASVYAAQQEMFNGTNFFRFTIGRSDDTNVIETNTYMYGADTFTETDGNAPLQTAWTQFYVLISRCNVILGRIDAVTFTDTNLKNYIKGEAYALRAWAYYSLGSSFGGVPLISKEMTVAETKTIARSTQAETFTFAENDYKSAIALLPASWTGTNLGRITKYAAEAGLARLYMFLSNFASAKTYLKDIIDSKLYGMEENYVNCFSDTYDNTKERVWEVQFSGGLKGEGQNLSGSCVPEGYKGTLSPFTGSSAAFHASSNLLAEYETGDLRKDATVVTGITVNGAKADYYCFVKYLHYSYTPQSTEDFAVNLPIVRYTDVLMMYAECLNEAAYVANGEAFNIINVVRARAGLAPLTSVAVANQSDFRKALQHERRIEFAFEPLRWPDLVRWGIAKDVMTKFLTDKDEGAGIYKMADYQTLYPIPAEEITRYNNKTIMWQNPGY